MRIYNLSKKAGEDFLKTVSSLTSSNVANTIPKAKNIKIAELDEVNQAIIFDTEIRLFFGRMNNVTYFPLLKDEQVLPKLPSVTVDMGAVKFVCNGANIMRPGILSFEGEFQKKSLVVVKEVSHSKAIAVGRAYENSLTIKAMPKGPTIENLHYVGDNFWESLKDLGD